MSNILRSQSRIKPHFVIMAALFIGAAGVGVLLLPGQNERIAMLERDGSYREALKILETRFESGDRAQRTLYQLQRLYEHFGDLEKSRRTLEMLAERRPRDAYVQRQLAYFYKATQDGEAYVAALRRQLSLRYSEPACRNLIGILRRNGSFELEQRRIELCRVAGYRRADDLIRLAFLSASDGNLNQTAQLLGAVDDRRKLASDRQQMMLFEALLQTNQPGEARRRGARWLKAAANDELALTLINGLSRKKRFELAIALARDVSRPGDSISLTVAELMLDQDQGVAARSYLRGWLEKTQFSQPGMGDRFVASALDADDLELALAGGRRVGLRALAPSSLTALAESSGVADRKDDLAMLAGLLPQESLSTNELLAAAVAQATGRRKEAKRLLARVQPEGLSERRRALWARLRRSLAAARRRR